jgi:hypothetical protein
MATVRIASQRIQTKYDGIHIANVKHLTPLTPRARGRLLCRPRNTRAVPQRGTRFRTLRQRCGGGSIENAPGLRATFSIPIDFEPGQAAGYTSGGLFMGEPCAATHPPTFPAPNKDLFDGARFEGARDFCIGLQGRIIVLLLTTTGQLFRMGATL